MTQIQSAVQGDVGDLRSIQLDGITDLTAVTSIEAHVWKGDDAATLTTTVTDAANRIVSVNLGGIGGWLATADVGSWFFEIQATLGTTVLTWPNRANPDVIEVRAGR